MRIGTSHRNLLAILATTFAMTGIFASSAQASGYPTINKSWDVNAICLSFGFDCSAFLDKWQAWTNAGPADNMLLPDGNYFFAVLDDLNADMNDGGSGNLSTSDSLSNRTFSVSAGKISGYSGTHRYMTDTYDHNEKKVQLAPFGDSSKTTSGVYHVAICKKKSTGRYSKSDCSYHTIRCGPKDPDPPKCPNPTFGFNGSGQGTATQVISDAGGLQSIEVVDIVNATWSVPAFSPGTTASITLQATRINPAKGTRIVIKVKDISGNVSFCDPVLATLKVSKTAGAGADNAAQAKTFHVTSREDTVRVVNGGRGFSKLAVVVNGKRFAVTGLRNGQHVNLKITSALLAQGKNKVTLQGFGRRGSNATFMIS